MKTEKKQHFLALVPHRDARIQLQKQSESLIKNGLSNVYPFPHAAVLASLSKPLNDDELKKTAKAIRETIGKEKFVTNEMLSTSILINDNLMFLYGSKLDFNLDCAFRNAADKIINKTSPVLIGSFISHNDIEQQVRDGAYQRYECGSWLNNSISFRAAAVANMYWKQIKIKNEICYKWKIGKLFWLPKP